MANRVNISSHVSSLKLPNIQQQLAVVNNQALKQLYLSQRAISTAQHMGKALANAKSVFKK